jgi:hypothetical protein
MELVMITNSMKDGVVQYGDTFLDGTRYNQKATERRLTEGARFYSGTKSAEFMQGYLAANKIVKDVLVPKTKPKENL